MRSPRLSTMFSSFSLLLFLGVVGVSSSPAASRGVLLDQQKRGLQQQCADNNESCGWWASQGECQRNPRYMLSNCALSCDVCTPADTTQPSCVDTNPSCAPWASGGECQANPGYMHVHCRASCGLCDPVMRDDPEPSPPVSRGGVPTPQQWLSAVNAKRRCHGGMRADLIWDAGLARSLETFLSTIVASGQCTTYHDTQIFPEILYGPGSDVATLAHSAVESWYSEIRDYDFTMPGVNDFSSNPTTNTNARTGHFRSLVWLGMTRLGCATVECSGMNTGRFITGCRLADRPYDGSNLPRTLCGEPGDWCVDPDGSVHRRNVLPASC
mmetsp:Transcript_13422/g.26542  ORF Transcript_13422/g.26542 Transcript_13422/m.26542 type:complete len:326 (-) Transcript_13422:478-1455(-)